MPDRARKIVSALLEEQIPGGLASDKPDSDFDPEQLQKGIEVEMEHTDNRTVAREIAKDHLAENPSYYTMLARCHKD